MPISDDGVSFFSGAVAGAVAQLVSPEGPLAPADHASFMTGYAVAGVMATSVHIAMRPRYSYTPVGLRRPALAFVVPFFRGFFASTLAAFLFRAISGAPTSK